MAALIVHQHSCALVTSLYIQFHAQGLDRKRAYHCSLASMLLRSLPEYGQLWFVVGYQCKVSSIEKCVEFLLSNTKANASWSICE